jgi:DNA-binding transcriptional ArsR family regulator
MDPGPVFAALTDPTRRAILERVAASGDATPTALAAGLPVTRQAVAKHLAVLHRAGLVKPQPGAPPCQLLEPGQAT